MQPRGLKLVLMQALVANEKMDWIIEKACELGYAEIAVFPSERGEVRLTCEKAVKRVERWNKIAVSACQQCGENYLPNIRFCSSLKDAAAHAEGLKFVLTRSERLTILLTLRQRSHSPWGLKAAYLRKEINTLIESGFYSCQTRQQSPKNRNGALAAASFAQTLWGDFR